MDILKRKLSCASSYREKTNSPEKNWVRVRVKD